MKTVEGMLVHLGQRRVDMQCTVYGGDQPSPPFITSMISCIRMRGMRSDNVPVQRLPGLKAVFGCGGPTVCPPRC